MQTERIAPQTLTWLILGMVMGLVGVLNSVLVPSSSDEVDLEVVAMVNGSPISREKYLSYLQALSADRKDPISAEDSEYVLQRIIEEELLVQRGVEVGLLDSDRRTRAALVAAMISMTTTAAEAKAPSEEELAEFFQENRDYFSGTARLRVRQLMVKGEDSDRRAQLAYQRLLSGEDFQSVEREVGSQTALSVPDSLLPPSKLREYLGPTLTAALLQETPGFITEPQPLDTGFRIVQLVDLEVAGSPRLEEVRGQLEAEYVRRAGDVALREYLDWLKDRADISYPSELPL